MHVVTVDYYLRLVDRVFCLESRDQAAQESWIGHRFSAGGDDFLHCRENSGDDGFLRCRSLAHGGQDIVGYAVQAETIL